MWCMFVSACSEACFITFTPTKGTDQMTIGARGLNRKRAEGAADPEK